MSNLYRLQQVKSALKLISSLLLCLLASPAIFSAQEPQGQPEQIKTPIEYNQHLTNPFFQKKKFTYPWWIIENDDGSIEDTRGEITNKKDAPRLLLTADCRTNHQGDHKIRFSNAKLLPDNFIEILVYEETASTYDNLKITIKDGTFSCQYWTVYPGNRFDEGLIWTTKKQKLVLNKEHYQAKDLIKGSIDFECVEQATNPKYGDDKPVTIKIKGVFKSILEN